MSLIVGQHITIILPLIVGQNDTEFVGQNDTEFVGQNDVIDYNIETVLSRNGD